MIIKNLSRKGGGSAPVLKYIFRYVFRDADVPKRRSRKTYIPVAEKDHLKDRIPYLYALRSANVRFYRRDIDHLIQEKVDVELLRDFMRSSHGQDYSSYIKQYLAQEQEFKEKDQFILTHNIRPYTSIDGLVRQFEDNERNRVSRRKDSPTVHHTVISFSHKEERDKISDDVLRSVVKEYIRLRGEDILYAGTKHEDTRHVHVHLCMSATRLDGRSSRISKEDFAEIKDRMTNYVRENFPFIKHSFPEHGKKRNELDRGGLKNYKRNERESVKSKLMEAITTIRPMSTKHLLEELSAQGFVSYNRANQLTGIRHTESNLKFRFSKIGIDVEELKRLDERNQKEEEMLADISRLRNSAQRRMLEIDEAERGEKFAAVKDNDDLKDIEDLRESRMSEPELDEPEREFESDDEDVDDPERDDNDTTDYEFDDEEREPNEEYDEDQGEENENSYE